MIAAQVLSIVAFLISWLWWVTFIVAIAALVLLQVMWCCRQSKTGLFVSVGISAVTGCMCIAAGIIMLVKWKNQTWCGPFIFDDDDGYDFNYGMVSSIAYNYNVTDDDFLLNFYNMTDDDFVLNMLEHDHYMGHSDYCREEVWATVAFITAALWFSAAACLVYFVKSGRHAKWEERIQCSVGDGDGNGDGNATTTIEMGAVQQETHPTATATSTSPDPVTPAVETAVAMPVVGSYVPPPKTLE